MNNNSSSPGVLPVLLGIGYVGLLTNAVVDALGKTTHPTAFKFGIVLGFVVVVAIALVYDQNFPELRLFSFGWGSSFLLYLGTFIAGLPFVWFSRMCVGGSAMHCFWEHAFLAMVTISAGPLVCRLMTFVIEVFLFLKRFI